MNDDGDKTTGDDEKQESLLTRLWRWWTAPVHRLPDRLFAPKAEPLPEAPTWEEFEDRVIDEVETGPTKEDYERELKRIEGLSAQQKALHDETSKTIRRVFYALVGTCLFCVVTLAGASDLQLLGQEATVTLPALNYKMDFQAFLLVGPVVLVALTVYLHIFVAQHRKVEVPKELEHPMLPNFAGWTPRLVVLLIFYWMVPITLAVFAWKAWPRPIGPYLGYFTMGVTAALVILQFRRCPRAWRDRALPALGVTFLIFYIGFFSITDVRVLNLFKADLKGKDLRSINLSGAFLSEANLSRARLGHANLGGADMKGANFQGAQLEGALLYFAYLQGASLIGANLTKVDLEGTNLKGADLQGANLIGANLQEANLQEANLQEAVFGKTFNKSGARTVESITLLARADLSSSEGLTQEQLDKACGDEKTKLPPKLTIKPCKKAKAGAGAVKTPPKKK